MTGTFPNGTKRRYSYQYDGLNRLLQGVYSQPGSSVTANDYYNEILSYDINGNIRTLKRFSAPSTGGTTAEKIDDLIYNYIGNQLDKITLPTGVVNNPSGYNALQNTISYDFNGNMTIHPDKGISAITYNYLNLPSRITKGGGKGSSRTNYLYRADGTKVRKTLNTTTTDYLDGFQYFKNDSSFICLDCPPPPPVQELQFVPTSEGYYDFVKNKYIYNYVDHLGNTRLSYFHNGSSIEVLEENNYYPFGLKHEGYNVLAGNSTYQYKYNGKELQTETGMYDYGARFYMPDIGRWGVVDPLAEKYRKWSPYNYTVDDPINHIDPDGRDIIFVHVVNENTQIHLRYSKGNFYYLNGDKKGQKYDGRKDHVSQNLFRLAKAYRTIEHSNNKILKGELHHLENSKNKHYIFDPQTPNQGSGVQGTADGGSQTIFNLSSKEEKERFKKMEGVPNSDLSTVAHEMQHQYDKDINNQSDATNTNDAQNPAEQRGVKTENEARKIEGLPLRTTYGGEKVTSSPQNYKVPQ